MKLFENISDSELARKINAGEKNAYQELFERYAPRIYQFSLLYLKNQADAEELVQDVFLKIWEKRETLDQSKNIKAFIFKIAVNTIYDFIRRKNIENAFNDFARANFETGSNNTWHTVIYDEMQENLQKLVAQLPGQQQKIFQLSKEEGLTSEEIAVKLNLSKRTVDNHLYRAVSFLKENFRRDSFISVLFFYLICG
ncbi:MAG: RNA polymerase sigma-70 factor [Draconibacterium sp.]|nr:RNA polymerase sigma-70 factor [Draconibacterium sp.]